MKQWTAASWILLLPVACGMAAAIWQMRYDWTYDETYHYGWAVLPLALYLFSLRWRDRPAPGVLVPVPLLRLAALVLGALWPLGWLLREANPDWRLLSVFLSVLAVGTGWLFICAIGGRVWGRHFSGPATFFLTAIPWPSVMEKAATAVLMPANAVIALEVLHWLGIPAIRNGHLISLAQGTLGVEEACSGVRSLQATLMMALFLGELHSLRWKTRGLLLAAGVGVALLTNALRTVFLSTLAARSGMAATESWHDQAGLAALVLNVGTLFALTAWFSRRSCHVRLLPLPATAMTRLQALPLKVDRTAWCLVTGGLVLMIPATHWWYGRHESVPLPAWSMTPPLHAPDYRPARIDDRTSLMLRYSEGWSARWRSASGQPLHGYFFAWNAGRIPPENLNAHQPGDCLGALGMKMLKEYPSIPVPGLPALPQARHLCFDDNGRPLHLLYFSSETAVLPQKFEQQSALGPFDFTYSKRWQSAIQGRRNPGQRLLEVGLWEETSEESARAVFREVLGKIKIGK